MTLVPVSPEELAWTQAQPLVGSPSLSRLAAALSAAGWEPQELALSKDGESVEYSLGGQTLQGRVAIERENTLRTLIRVFRQAGFRVGFTEVAIGIFDGERITGSSLVGPLEQVCTHGPMSVEP